MSIGPLYVIVICYTNNFGIQQENHYLIQTEMTWKRN